MPARRGALRVDRDFLHLDGQEGTDLYHIQTTDIDSDNTTRTDYLVNIHDSGDRNDGIDSLIIEGQDDASGGDVFLVRHNFIARMHGDPETSTFDPEFERINYDETINARVTVNGWDGDDFFFVDDNSAIMTLDGEDGVDTFQIGQVLGDDPNHPVVLTLSAAAWSSGTNTLGAITLDGTETTAGNTLDVGAAHGMTTGDLVEYSSDLTVDTSGLVNGQEYEVVVNTATEVQLLDPNRLVFDAALQRYKYKSSHVHQGDEIEGTLITRGFLSNGITNPLVLYGGEDGDLIAVYSNKGELRLEGEGGNDEFLIRAVCRRGRYPAQCRQR